MTTPILGLPELAAGQVDAYLAHNEALRSLEVFGKRVVQSITLTSPPTNPVAGLVYIPASPATGLWVGLEKKLTTWDGFAWTAYLPYVGLKLWVINENKEFIFDNNQNWVPVSDGGIVFPVTRILLLQTLNIYVDTDNGNDSNDGLTLLSAFKTWQKAIDYITGTFDIGIFDVNINGTGISNEIIFGKKISGAGSINLIGSGKTTTKIAAFYCLLSNSGGVGAYTIDALKIEGSTELVAVDCTIVNIKNIEYGSSNGNHNICSSNGVINFTSNYSISGGGTTHISCYDLGKILANNALPNTVTIANSPNFTSAFAVAGRQGSILMVNQNYIGNATGNRKIINQGGCCIVVGGVGSGHPNYFPGNSPGSVDSSTYSIYA